jgi:hypothetical protein
MWARLTQEQAEAFKSRVQPMLRFLHRCRRRLDTRVFDPKSPLYAAVAKAYDAVHGLHVELHYLSVRRGVGKPQAEAEEEGKSGREWRCQGTFVPGLTARDHRRPGPALGPVEPFSRFRSV